MLDLQRSYGNIFMRRLVQRNCRLSKPGDHGKQEADRIANAVMHQELQGSAGSSQTQSIHTQMAEEAEEMSKPNIATVGLDARWKKRKQWPQLPLVP